MTSTVTRAPRAPRPEMRAPIALRKVDVCPWRDADDIRHGASITREVEDGLRASHSAIIIFTHDYLETLGPGNALALIGQLRVVSREAVVCVLRPQISQSTARGHTRPCVAVRVAKGLLVDADVADRTGDFPLLPTGDPPAA